MDERVYDLDGKLLVFTVLNPHRATKVPPGRSLGPYARIAIQRDQLPKFDVDPIFSV
jgi:hypothetical protein